MATKHLFRRTIIRNGKQIKVWYYWFYDATGRQVRRSCGTNGKPCLTKREAERFLETIDDSDLFTSKGDSVGDFISGLYDDGSLFLRRKELKGYAFTEKTKRQRRYLLNLFVERFGGTVPRKLSLTEIEDWLLSFNYSNSWRNHFLAVIKDVYEVLYNSDAIRKMPVLSRFKVKSTSSKGILSKDELERLFPRNTEELMKIWSVKSNDSPYHAFSACCACFCAVSTGMRSGEIRALQKKQFIRRDAILLNAMIDSDGNRIEALKKHTEDDNKWRVVVLPERAVEMLFLLDDLRITRRTETDYVFERNGKFLDGGYINDRIRYALRNIGIDAVERNITMHSLRFTYNSIMRREISGEDLRLLMGHESEKMTNYYDKSSALDNLPSLMRNKERINEIWQ